MSTRGFIGFKTNTKKNRDNNIFGVYNHYDSYYSYKGVQILDIYKETTKEDFESIFNAIIWSDNIDNVDIDGALMFNGEYDTYKIGNDASFLNDGLFCEYGYVYNLENDTLEIYRGFFSEPESDELENLGYESRGDKFHTHKVYTVTRDSNFDKVKYMFSNINRDEKYCDKANEIDNGKYIEDIYMEKLDDNLLYEYGMDL